MVGFILLIKQIESNLATYKSLKLKLKKEKLSGWSRNNTTFNVVLVFQCNPINYESKVHKC